MTAFLSTTFVILLLVVFVIVSSVVTLLNLLAGKGRASVLWLFGCAIGIGFLFFTLGGV